MLDFVANSDTPTGHQQLLSGGEGKRREGRRGEGKRGEGRGGGGGGESRCFWVMEGWKFMQCV